MKLYIPGKKRTKPEVSKKVDKDNRKEKKQDIPTSLAKKEQEKNEGILRPNPAEFAALVAREIVKNLNSLRTVRPFSKDLPIEGLSDIRIPEGNNLMIIDTSVLIDGRILSVINSGFITGTLLVPKFVLGELQHIADSSDSLRRAKGRRGLDIVQKMINQKTNNLVVTKVIQDDVEEIKEVDHKLAALAKQWKTKLVTVDYNLAQLARAQGVKVLNLHDLAQAIKLSILPGEELNIKITHEGKERDQGVGYLPDGTMVVVDNAKDKVGIEVVVIISRVVNTPAGQLFFARLK
jgi:uncharacterized protein YacL